MGSATAETVKEIEETRERLERNIEALEERLPAPALMAKRAAGTIVGGGLAGSVAMFLIRRARKRRGDRKEAEMPPIQIRPVIQVTPEDGMVVERGGVRGWLIPVAAMAGWAIARLIEARRSEEADVIVDVTDATMDPSGSPTYAGE